MKLVDILARELKEWPDKFGGPTDFCVASRALGGFAAWFCERRPIYEYGGWTDVGTVELWLSELPSDAAGCIVTRAQWQAAVDALKAEAVPAWVGAGLPPVGTVCEHGRLIPGEWCVVEIVAHRRFKGCGFLSAVYVHDDGVGHASVGDHFRPILTPEQIAADQRRNGIKAILDDYSYTVGPCTHKLAESQAARIWDAGYRKFEIVDKDDGEGEG